MEKTPQQRSPTGGEIGATWLALLTSAGTLVCCALPVLLISFGLGTALASLTGSVPWLVELSRHKVWIFVASFLTLVVSGWLIGRSGRRCPADRELARACKRVSAINRWVFATAVTIWLIGFFSAFLLLPISEWVAPGS